MAKNETKSLGLTLPEAKALYQSASADLRKKLEDLFGKKELVSDILELLQICSLDECHQATGRPKITNIAELPVDLHPLFMRYYSGLVMVEYANEGRKLSYLNTNEKKCYPYYDLSAGGLAFDDTYYNCTFANAGDASRQRFISEDRARAMGQNSEYKEIVKDIMEL